MSQRSLQRRAFYREQNWSICLNANFIRFDVVTCANLATHVRIPFLDVPLKTNGGDSCGTPHRKQTNVLCEDSAGLQTPKDVVFASKNEGQTALREKPESQARVLGLLSDHLV